MLSWLLDALFPGACAGCGTVGGTAFCCRCEASLCFDVRRCGTLDVFSLGSYEGQLRRAILAYKRGRCDAGDALGRLLAAACVRAIPPDALIVPVTTTARRRRERGFDQSVRLAGTIAREFRRPTRSVLRQTAGDAQRGRSRVDRLLAAGRYTCDAPAAVAGCNVVLVDDVVTTGATLFDCASVLRACGATVTTAIVLARA